MPFSIRPAEPGDIPAMTALRAQEWETEPFWLPRIRRYLSGEHSPQHALSARAAFVAEEDGVVVGFVSGHLPRRYGCTGELQWLNVSMKHRRTALVERSYRGCLRGLSSRVGCEFAWMSRQKMLRARSLC